jgi:hypothetical protein
VPLAVARRAGNVPRIFDGIFDRHSGADFCNSAIRAIGDASRVQVISKGAT